MMKLLIATDGSSHARRAISVVGRLSQLCGGVAVTLVNVRDTPPYYGDLPPVDFDSLDQLLKRRQDEVLHAALEEAKSDGLLQVTAQKGAGDAALEIVRIADELDVDQIVMGTHGRGSMANLLLGSVAQRVVNLSKVPVLLVK